MNSKYITDINVKCKAVKLLGDTKGKNQDGLGFEDDFHKPEKEAMTNCVSLKLKTALGKMLL